MCRATGAAGHGGRAGRDQFLEVRATRLTLELVDRHGARVPAHPDPPTTIPGGPRPRSEAGTQARPRRATPTPTRPLKPSGISVRELERDLPEAPGASTGTARLPRLALVGRGRMGGALARAASAAGLDHVVVGRDDLAAARGAKAVLLCVPDEAIPAACESVLEVAGDLELIGHTSGATGLDALGASSREGADAFSLHPLQTVRDAGSEVVGAPCAVAGSSPAAMAFARELATRLGMHPFEVPEEGRAAYHAGAAIASNFLVALAESAAELLERSGVADARELLAPLVLRSASNWADHGGDALTGPIARGDEATVSRHLEALREAAPELVPMYEALAERTRELAAER